MNGLRGYEVMLRADGTLSAGLHHVAPDNSIEIETSAPVVKPGTWQQITLTYDGSSRAAGIGLFVDGVRPPPHVIIDHLRRSILHDGHQKNWDGGGSPIRIGRRGDERLDAVTVDELRVFDRQLSRLEVDALAGIAIRSAPCCGSRRRAGRPNSRPRCASTICCASTRPRRPHGAR